MSAGASGRDVAWTSVHPHHEGAVHGPESDRTLLRLAVPAARAFIAEGLAERSRTATTDPGDVPSLDAMTCPSHVLARDDMTCPSHAPSLDNMTCPRDVPPRVATTDADGGPAAPGPLADHAVVFEERLPERDALPEGPADRHAYPLVPRLDHPEVPGADVGDPR